MPPEYAYFSLVPLDAVLTGVSIENAKYPLRDAVVTRAGMVTISNEAIADSFSVTIREGRSLGRSFRATGRAFWKNSHQNRRQGRFFYPFRFCNF